MRAQNWFNGDQSATLISLIIKDQVTQIKVGTTNDKILFLITVANIIIILLPYVSTIVNVYFKYKDVYAI